MRLVPVLCILSVLTSVPASVAARQNHHPPGDRRAASVMGFDQERTTHHFSLFKDGGAVDVSVKNASDTKDREAIRSHLQHIAGVFASGNVDAPMLVHDSADVPGSRGVRANGGAPCRSVCDFVGNRLGGFESPYRGTHHTARRVARAP